MAEKMCRFRQNILLARSDARKYCSRANTLSNVKSKDQITFEYSLALVNDNVKIAGEILKAKAKSDGEDVVSPMIEKMMTVVQTAAK